jgi:hypothetical protein
MIVVLSFIALSASFVSTALAESAASTDPRGPMRYTRIQDAPADSDNPAIKMRTIKHEDAEADKPETETSQTRIWNKYKALATGQTEEEKAEAKKAAKKAEAEAEEKAAIKAKEKSAAKTAAKEAEKEPAPTGIGALLSEYKKNKAMRSQMHTINVTEPEEKADPGKEPADNRKEDPES